MVVHCLQSGWGRTQAAAASHGGRHEERHQAPAGVDSASLYSTQGEGRALHSCLSELVGGKYREPVANFRHTQPLIHKDALLCCTCVAGDVAASYVTCLVRWNCLSLRLMLLLSKPLVL